ncbi:MAG: alanine racemase [Acidimicrobiaceae bacterium]|nr:alanine racemase [Acidimicrobiaceae bacterium]
MLSGQGRAERSDAHAAWAPVTPTLPAAVLEAGRLRPAWAEVDLDAIQANAELLVRTVAPSRLCAVVKAGAYGHGSVPVARAALAGGATHLAVALVEEGRRLRDAGIEAPVLILSEPPAAAMNEVVASGLTPTIYTRAGLDAISAAARSGAPKGFAVHVKVDTGMHRVGAPPASAVALALEVGRRPELALEGFWTHFAVADDLADPYTSGQVADFEAAVASLAAAGIRPPLLHAANSAGAIWHPAARFDLVRCGIALYGLAPAAELAGAGVAALLRPAMSLRARVSHTKTVKAGERLSYGLRYRLEEDSVIATIPLGYADGVTRRLSSTGGQVLIRGRRCRLAGAVTMDQILVDCGPGAEVAIGDEVVLLGRQGGEVIDAWEWAQRTDTIAWEVVCGVSGRVPRTYRGHLSANSEGELG